MIIDLADRDYYNVSQHRYIENYYLRCSPFAIRTYSKKFLSLSAHVRCRIKDRVLFHLSDPSNQSAYYFQQYNKDNMNLDRDLRLTRKYNK